MSQSTRLFKGLPVVDATKPVAITITKRDLTGGYTRLPNYCVVAHAFKRALHQEAVVHTSKVYVKNGDHWLRYEASYGLKIEIIVHDRGGEFKEGEYRIKPPAPAKRFGTLHKSYQPKGKRRSHAFIRDVRERASYEGKE